MQRKEILSEYERYLQQTAGLAEITQAQYVYYIRQYFDEAFEKVTRSELRKLKPGEVIQYVVNQRKDRKTAAIKAICTALRSFFRFLQMEGICEGTLVESVPAVAGWKLSGLPHYLTKEQLNKLLASFDRTTPGGCRDYAIILCLAELGLRRKEVADLTLDDIDWRKGIIRIPAGKTRHEDKLPLSNAVGEAIADYLQYGRPETDERRIFVCYYSRVGAPISAGAITAVVKRAFQRLGLDVPTRGAHILRRTVATQMVQEGVSIKEVSDFLRHQSLDTTMIYTKVNLPMLREAVLPWPKGDEGS